jgi:hypothetical protein
MAFRAGGACDVGVEPRRIKPDAPAQVAVGSSLAAGHYFPMTIHFGILNFVMAAYMAR